MMQRTGSRRLGVVVSLRRRPAVRRSAARTADAASADRCHRRQPAATESAEHGALQEVTVTATRHEESLSKVPISVTALTQDDMDDRGIKDFQDIVRFTPGVLNRQLRHQRDLDPRHLLLGGAPVPPASTSTTRRSRCARSASIPTTRCRRPSTCERVEVLRGPQGTLFGAGAEGGAVRYILDAAEPHHRQHLRAQRDLLHRSTVSRATSSASPTAARSSTAPSVFAPASGTATTAAGSIASIRHDRRGAGRINVNYSTTRWCCGWRASGSRATRLHA